MADIDGLRTTLESLARVTRDSHIDPSDLGLAVVPERIGRVAEAHNLFARCAAGIAATHSPLDATAEMLDQLAR